MRWEDVVAIASLVIGGIGICLMVAAFALTASRGGWDQAITKPIAEKRWPVQRWFMAIGAGLCALTAITWLFVGVISRVILNRPWP
jgi:hypothetical protein